MISVFQVIICSVILCLMQSVSSHAKLSEAYDLDDARDIARSIGYKAQLKTPFSQLENWTSERISCIISYVTSNKGFFQNEVKAYSTIIIQPRQMRIFSPDALEAENYWISQVQIMNYENFIIEDKTEIKNVVRHIYFFQSTTLSLATVSNQYQLMNINLAKKG